MHHTAFFLYYIYTMYLHATCVQYTRAYLLLIALSLCYLITAKIQIILVRNYCKLQVQLKFKQRLSTATLKITNLEETRAINLLFFTTSGCTSIYVKPGLIDYALLHARGMRFNHISLNNFLYLLVIKLIRKCD